MPAAGEYAPLGGVDVENPTTTNTTTTPTKDPSSYHNQQGPSFSPITSISSSDFELLRDEFKTMRNAMNELQTQLETERAQSRWVGDLVVIVVVGFMVVLVVSVVVVVVVVVVLPVVLVLETVAVVVQVIVVRYKLHHRHPCSSPLPSSPPLLSLSPSLPEHSLQPTVRP